MDVIDNFPQCFENAETEIMLKRFRDLARYFGNDAERKKKLRNLMEDPDHKIFKEKLEELFERDERGAPTHSHKRAKYEDARVGGIWGRDLLRRLEGDYIDIQEERKPLYE